MPTIPFCPVALSYFGNCLAPLVFPLGVFGFNSTGLPDFVTASGFTVFPVRGSFKDGFTAHPFFPAFWLKSLCAAFPLSTASFVLGFCVPLQYRVFVLFIKVSLY